MIIQILVSITSSWAFQMALVLSLLESEKVCRPSFLTLMPLIVIPEETPEPLQIQERFNLDLSCRSSSRPLVSKSYSYKSIATLLIPKRWSVLARLYLTSCGHSDCLLRIYFIKKIIACLASSEELVERRFKAYLSKEIDRQRSRSGGPCRSTLSWTVQ